MFKFVVNLFMMFIEVFFFECFKVVKDMGFGGVEFLFFYDYLVD